MHILLCDNLKISVNVNKIYFSIQDEVMKASIQRCINPVKIINYIKYHTSSHKYKLLHYW